MSDFGDLPRLHRLSVDLTAAADAAMAVLRDYEETIAKFNFKFYAEVRIAPDGKLCWAEWSTGWGLGYVVQSEDPVRVKDAPRPVRIVATQYLSALTKAIVDAGERLIAATKTEAKP